MAYKLDFCKKKNTLESERAQSEPQAHYKLFNIEQDFWLSVPQFFQGEKVNYNCIQYTWQLER